MGSLPVSDGEGWDYPPVAIQSDWRSGADHRPCPFCTFRKLIRRNGAIGATVAISFSGTEYETAVVSELSRCVQAAASG